MKSYPLDSRFLSALCHDLRGSLGALGTWIEVLASGRADAAIQAQALAAMARDVRTQSALIEQVSQLGALLESDQTRELSRIDLLPLVASVLAAAPASGLPVALQAEEPGPVVAGDPARLRSLVTLLLTEAVRSPPGTALQARVFVADQMAEMVVEAKGAARVVSVALARAIAEGHAGTLDENAALGYTTLRLRLPLHQ